MNLWPCCTQVRDLLIDAENENVGLGQELLEETHEDLNALEDCLKRCVDGRVSSHSLSSFFHSVFFLPCFYLSSPLLYFLVLSSYFPPLCFV